MSLCNALDYSAREAVQLRTLCSGETQQAASVLFIRLLSHRGSVAPDLVQW